MAKSETPNGAAQTATEKKEVTMRSIRTHINELKRVLAKTQEITALKRTEVGSIIKSEIEKAVNLAKKLQEKELNDLLK